MVLNMTASEAEAARQGASAVAGCRPEETVRIFSKLKLPAHHPIFSSDISADYLKKILLKTYEQPPADFVQLLLTPGVGPKTIRALALVAEVIYGAPLSFRDPVTYTFAHGGKDGYPYPVSQEEYDRSLSFLEKGIREAKIGQSEKLNALRRLEQWSRGLTRSS